jgi:hypothetical protein
MPNENSLPRSIDEYLPEEEEPPQYAASPRWFAGGAEEPEAPQRSGDVQARSELYRAGKIDAYLRYLKMQPPARDAESVTLRRSIPVRERPAFRPYDDEDREVHFYGYQRRSIRRSSSRVPRGTLRKPRRSLAKEIAIAVALSLAVGGVTGLIVYDRTSGGMIGETVMAAASGLWSGAASTVPKPAEAIEAPAALADASPEPVIAVESAAVSKKPVVIAELDVEDVSGLASSLIPLSVRADSGVPGQNLAFRLSGLPENAYLTAGTRVSGGAWMLKPGEEQGLKIMVPPNRTGQFAIAVEALEQRTGDLAAPIKEITVDVRPAVATNVEPAAAPVSVSRNFNLPQALPEAAQQPTEGAAPIPAPIEKVSAIQSDAAQALVRSGDKLMSLGDLTAARQFYEKALGEGVPEAALKLGQTYDPALFAEKNVQGLTPDPSMAMKYYLQAQTSGVADATRSINGLEAWMQK